MARFGELSDTDPRTTEVWLRLYQEMPPAERAGRAFEMLSLSMSLAEAGARLRYPDASPREIRLRAAATLYGSDLVQRAFGWSPEAGHGSGDRL